MTFRFGALLCLSGLAACSHTNSETAKDPAYEGQTAQASTEPSMTDGATHADGTTTTSADSTHAMADARDPVVANNKGTTGAAPASNAPSTPTPAPAPATPPATPASDTSKTAAAAPAGTAPDNTKVNKRDTNDAALTPLDQKENQTDLKITQQIRQAVMADGSLSFTAKNVKIITQNGKVTLRGPVNTAAERTAIEAAARKVAGATQIDNQLEVKK